jgi:site-specific recombinase XerD
VLLSTLVGEYSISHDVSSGYVQCLYNSVSRFSRFLGRLASIEDLNAPAINRFLRSLAEEGKKPPTIRGRRANLVVLWRFGHKLELLAAEPKNVKTIKIPETIPTAFLLEEISLLIKSADRLKGQFSNGRCKRLWWTSLLHAKYDTGLRLADVLSIERPWIQAGTVTIVQAKTGHQHTAPLRDSTLALIGQMMGKQATGLIWPLWGRREVFYRAFKKLREDAGLKAGTSRWLRRSSYSYVEASNPGMGAAHLGHKTPGLAKKHYEDRRIVRQKIVLPPSLSG